MCDLSADVPMSLVLYVYADLNPMCSMLHVMSLDHPQCPPFQVKFQSPHYLWVAVEKN